MNFFQRKSFKLLALATTITLYSCSPINNTDIPDNKKTDVNITKEITNNQDIIVSLDEIDMTMKPFTTLNPLLVTDVNVASTLNLVYDKLFVYDSGMIQSKNLVEDYYYDIDTNTVVLALKENILFSNGDTLTPQDVKYSLDTIKNAPKDTFYKKTLNGINSYKVTSNGLELRLEKDTTFFDLDLNIPIISKKTYEGMNHTMPYGTGLFMLGEEETYSKFSLVKNPYNTKESTITKINIEVLAEDEKAIVAFDKGIFDVTHTNINTWLKYKESLNIDVGRINTNELEFVAFNYNNGHLKNVELRKALKYSIPYHKTINDIYISFAKTTNTGVNPSSWLYNEISEAPIFDINYSKKLLLDIGYLYNSDQNYFYFIYTNQETGEEVQVPLELNVIVNEENEQRVTFAQLYKNQLEKIGLKINLNILPFDLYNEALMNGNYDLFIGGIHTPTNQMYMSIFNDKNPFNYNDDILNEKIVRAKKATTEDAFKSAMVDLQSHIAKEVVFLPVVYKEDAFLVNGTIEGAFFAYENIYYNIENWKISQKYINE